jgi:hypothetical protein
MALTVYLLHFTLPYKHAKHYIGASKREDFQNRIQEHREGRGANLMKVLHAAGIGFIVARVWESCEPGTERRKKNRGASRICPICKALNGGK